jgi:hypothetical protein
VKRNTLYSMLGVLNLVGEQISPQIGTFHQGPSLKARTNLSAALGEPNLRHLGCRVHYALNGGKLVASSFAPTNCQYRNRVKMKEI